MEHCAFKAVSEMIDYNLKSRLNDLKESHHKSNLVI